jgi:hypothetical protein
MAISKNQHLQTKIMFQDITTTFYIDCDITNVYEKGDVVDIVYVKKTVNSLEYFWIEVMHLSPADLIDTDFIKQPLSPNSDIYLENKEIANGVSLNSHADLTNENSLNVYCIMNTTDSLSGIRKRK